MNATMEMIAKDMADSVKEAISKALDQERKKTNDKIEELEIRISTLEGKK